MTPWKSGFDNAGNALVKMSPAHVRRCRTAAAIVYASYRLRAIGTDPAASSRLFNEIMTWTEEQLTGFQREMEHELAMKGIPAFGFTALTTATSMETKT